ncbi:hypothetical protein HJG54_06975 [Leptolyngbya sp. NK1-12]|uniref:Glycosyltransferase RgtA/B/C/D-like domain-containing protein n=1 Tax=Leptolyngbya sp. NK1-12 TaxID=2547451 RepID=A0AA96WDM7_9CYAN|nr:hypothetical protein HJG54_06975 [Leptolyngbya sp. NK1-12]
MPRLTKPLTPPQHHFLILLLLLLLGLGLRLWQLNSKPLWLDEVLTALFTMGRSYQDVPLQQFFPLTALDQLFTVQPGLSCTDIAYRITTESVHPPVFFCLLYRWLNWLPADFLRHPEHWIWALRFLPALFGVAAIGAIYWLNRVAFSAKAGLLAAALMAVSPFAVYLSQEARHYTLPMLLITLALAALVQMQQDLMRQNSLRPLVWLGWSLLNLLGLYTHYFCILALIAQIVALTGWMLVHQRQLLRRHWGAWGLAIAAIGIGYLPWLPTVMSHFSRPETDWLIPYKPDWIDRLEPLYQTLVGWTLMVIALPVENQPDWIAIPASLLMLGFMLWLVWQLKSAAPRLWQAEVKRPAILLIASFTGCILLQFFAIVYLLDKDLTVVPRYNFVYYPGVCALLAASLASSGSKQQAATSHDASQKPATNLNPGFLLLVGLLSSVMVVHGLAFQKSYHPDRVAADLAFEPDRPLAVVMSYRSPQEVGLGLSFALALRNHLAVLAETPQPVDEASVQFGFIDRSESYGQAWRQLASLPQPLSPPLNLWVIASPGMRTKDYPQRLRLNAPPTPTTRPKMDCRVDPEQFHRLGFPYQLFRCQPLRRRPSQTKADI